MARRKMVLAHPDLKAGLERVTDEDQAYLPWEPDDEDAKKHPIYHEVLTELLAKKVPAT